MVFTEFRFLIFFIIAFGVYWPLRANTARKTWLLACSYFFYGAWDWRFLGLLVLSCTVDYSVGLLLMRTDRPRARKWLISGSIVTNLTILGWFKYYNFFAESAVDFLHWLGLPASLPTLQVILPVGISFYTFQSLSYSIDVYRRDLKAVRNPVDLYLFVAFFPQLVAGPIVRAATFLPQLAAKRDFQSVDVRLCMLWLLVGFFKKACVSDNLAPFVDQYFSSPAAFTALSAWIGVLLYAAQIYCDFSGYTDMALGAAGLLGYQLTENFRFPYFASNVSLFWRRWHISLSTWLRDYLYIPLGGNRQSRLMTNRNLMLTMLLGGLWHGAAWTFVIWGAFHGLLLTLHSHWARFRGARAQTAATWIGIPLTFYVVCVAWIFFRSENLPSAMTTLNSFVLWHSPGTRQLHAGLLIILGALGCAHGMTLGLQHWNGWRRIPGWLFSVGVGILSAILLALRSHNYAPFIYFQF